MVRKKASVKVQGVTITTEAPQGNEARANLDDRAIFLHHLPIIAGGIAKKEAAAAALKKLYHEAKMDGFSKADFVYAMEVESVEKEKRTKATIARRLYIAKLMSSDLGQQYDLFSDAKPTSSTERSYEERITSGFTPFSSEELESQQALAEEASKH
jgi:hypothetical protein